MKKKLFIGLLPALMVLSACGGVAPTNEANYYLEDTLLHEEIFGSLDAPVSPIKSVRNLDPVDPTAPRVGVQYAEGSVADTTSVRYVAAVTIPKANLALYTATWTRTVYAKDGTVHKSQSTVNCTKVYESLNDGESTIEPGDFNTGSTYFVVYTLRNIPNSSLGGALLASVSVDDNDPETDPAVSKTIATRLETEENSVRVALTSTDLGKTGYFLKGTFSGEAGYKNCDSPLRKSGNAATFSVDLDHDDTFVIINNTAPKFQLFGSSCLEGADSGYLLQNSTGRIKVKNDGDYILFLNNSGEIYTALEDGYYITGEFCNWQVLPQNIMGAGNEDYEAIKENFVVSKANSIGIFGLYDGDKTWHGRGEGDSNTDLGTGTYNVYLGKDFHVSTSTVSRTSYFLNFYSGDIAAVGAVYAYMYGAGDLKNATWPGEEVSSLQNEYGHVEIDATKAYTNIIFSIHYNFSEQTRIEIAFSSLIDGSELKHSSWYDSKDHFWIGFKQYGSTGDFDPKNQN